MKDIIELGTVLNTYEKLQEAALIHNNCLNLDDIKFFVSSLLKYALYNFNLFEAFKGRLKGISTDIENLKKNLKICKRAKIDIHYIITELTNFIMDNFILN